MSPHDANLRNTWAPCVGPKTGTPMRRRHTGRPWRLIRRCRRPTTTCATFTAMGPHAGSAGAYCEALISIQTAPGPPRCWASRTTPSGASTRRHVYRQWLADEPDNPVPKHYLAGCTGEAVPARAEDAYVEVTFDAFAESFDANLEHLTYRAPQYVGAEVARLCGDAARALQVLDAGCGTGLCGPLVPVREAPGGRRSVGKDAGESPTAAGIRRAHQGRTHGVSAVLGSRIRPDHLGRPLCYFASLNRRYSSPWRTAQRRPHGFTVNASETTHVAAAFASEPA